MLTPSPWGVITVHYRHTRCAFRRPYVLMFRAHGLIEGDLYIGALFSIHDQVNHIDYDNICCCSSYWYFCYFLLLLWWLLVVSLVYSCWCACNCCKWLYWCGALFSSHDQVIHIDNGNSFCFFDILWYCGSAINLFSTAFHCFESWACDAANADDDDCVYDGIKKNVKVEAIAIAIFKFGSWNSKLPKS